MNMRNQRRYWIGVGIGVLLWLAPIAISVLDPNREPIIMPEGSTLLDVPGIYSAFALTVAMGAALGLGIGAWTRGDHASGGTRLAREALLVAGASYALVHYVPFALQFIPMLIAGIQHAARPVYFELTLYGLGTGTLTELLFASLAALGSAVGALSPIYVCKVRSMLG